MKCEITIDDHVFENLIEDMSNTEIAKAVLKAIFKKTYVDDWDRDWEGAELDIHNQFSLMFEGSVRTVLKNDFYRDYIKQYLAHNIGNFELDVKSEIHKILKEDIESFRENIRSELMCELKKILVDCEVDDLITRSFSLEEIQNMAIKKQQLEKDNEN